MQVQVLSIEVNQATSKAGKPYEQLVVAFKDLTNGGKVASKTIMPFGFQKDTFTTMKAAKPADVFDVEVQKNDAGYNDWIRAKKGTASVQTTQISTSTSTVTASTGAKSGGWETPEERAKKQIYIVRQSSLSNAVATLSVGVKTAPKAEEVIELARQYEAFVFESDKAQTVASKDVGSIETLDEDIPY